MAERLTSREFARRARCDEKQVRRAIQHGVLQRDADGLLDAAQLGNGWRKTNRRGRVKAEHADADNANVRTGVTQGHHETPEEAAERMMLTLAPHTRVEAERIKENYLASLRALEYKIKSGQVVELEAVETEFYAMARTQRDAWLSWPLTAGPILAADLGVEADRLTQALTELVHDHITRLSTG